MNYLIFLLLGFGALWAGLKLFDDEVLLIVTLFVGSGLVLVGLVSSPVQLQVVIEVALIAGLFHTCMECIERGGRA
ncbi:hypothetical protein S7335_435 [Synechococcus sp. PCC 7335]|uniref:hypothetical protein n=1 Tax=Synechococcus sp. (strain ATCC 29403 / PCC 7335) TaxID=91464 RepID=UPI00017EB52B|nr:hypothetical protein [Synechococcus sp. PCC 7335]EDX83255.1 hypothetical protein S7335_435 [Synechococcus sp. PCC 7335]